MYLAGVSVRRVEDITEAGNAGEPLGGQRLNKKIYERIEISKSGAISQFSLRIVTSISMAPL